MFKSLKPEKKEEYAFLVNCEGGYSVLVAPSTFLQGAITFLSTELGKPCTTIYAGHADKSVLRDVLDAIVPAKYTLLNDLVVTD